MKTKKSELKNHELHLLEIIICDTMPLALQLQKGIATMVSQSPDLFEKNVFVNKDHSCNALSRMYLFTLMFDCIQLVALATLYIGHANTVHRKLIFFLLHFYLCILHYLINL